MNNPKDKNAAAVKVSLTRDLRLFGITMIGAGIFVVTGLAAGQAGPALLLAFFLNGVIALFTAASYAELGAALPEAGERASSSRPPQRRVCDPRRQRHRLRQNIHKASCRPPSSADLVCSIACKSSFHSRRMST